MNAGEINIYDNQNLSECCISSNWEDAEELGSVSSFTIYGNAAGCSSYEESQLACNGTVLGCTESGAVNYNSEATIEDGSCLNGIDLQVSVNTILNSLQVNSFQVPMNAWLQKAVLQAQEQEKHFVLQRQYLTMEMKILSLVIKHRITANFILMIVTGIIIMKDMQIIKCLIIQVFWQAKQLGIKTVGV